MFSMIMEFFSYSFITRALIAGIPVALCASLLGVSLVLKRYSMIGDGLSHVGFGALALAAALRMAPLQTAIPIVLVAAFLLLRLSENSKINSDASIALISVSALAAGVIILHTSNGISTDIVNYMFGSILAIGLGDLYICLGVGVFVLVMYVLFYNRIFAVTFDENFARATGTNTGLYNLLIAALTAVVIVIGMRMMGALLISGLVIFPVLTAMRVFSGYRQVVICSAVCSVVCFFCGMLGSFVFSAPAGASVIVVNLIAFCAFCLAGVFLKAG